MHAGTRRGRDAGAAVAAGHSHLHPKSPLTVGHVAVFRLPALERIRPAQVAIDLGSPISRRSSSDFEDVGYPSQYHPRSPYESTHPEEELPSHYMQEETTRRRGPRAAQVNEYYDEVQQESYYDDEGKDVYSKMSAAKTGLGGGRVRRPPAPPPSNLVRGRVLTIAWPAG